MKGNMESRSPKDTRSRVRPSPACTAHTAPLPDSVLLGDRACVLFLVVCLFYMFYPHSIQKLGTVVSYSS